MSDIKNLQNKIIKYRDERDWKKFHLPKDLAADISIEASEILEHFLWKNEKEQLDHIHKHKEEVAEEMVDVLSPLLIMAHDYDIDLVTTFEKKIKKNAKKYPVSKVKGKNWKYTDYE
jgi:dCTP diphosphatase